MSKLLVAVAALALALPASAQQIVSTPPARLAMPYDNTLFVPNSTNYYQGSYLLFNAPFVTGYTNTNTTRFNPTVFPNTVSIQTVWPVGGCGGGICGYMNLQYGFQNAAQGPVNIASTQVKNINTLTHNISVNFWAPSLNDMDGVDVIDDIFLTPTSKDPANRSDEIEVFLHSNSSAISFMNAATQLPNFTDQFGVVWQVAYYGMQTLPDLLFMPVDRRDISGQIDLKAMLAYMVTEGRLTGNEWFNGYQSGVEPFHGTFRMNITANSNTYN